MFRFLIVSTLMLFAAQAHAVSSADAPNAPKPKPAAAKEEAKESAPKTYPADVKEAYLRSCVGLHKELIPSCKCMILTFQKMVPYPEFEELMNMENPTEDNRFLKVAGACMRAQQQAQP